MFLVAGYDTTTSLLSFSSFLLAKHKDQQQRLRDELRQLVKENGCITYQGIIEAKLLEACLQETLRLYPPGIQLERACTKACSYVWAPKLLEWLGYTDSLFVDLYS
ncbi:Cytochrome P450 9e2 [Portunus trituberculatus]|uniref:Cytochrome P450 9e2 n=1 Tax=Portunus trituberculatus TaxID=210409 RepID=A0A5B7D676_PORTR|nr:Cytochrome P450 9e2 [Portunus trituberculatus]